MCINHISISSNLLSTIYIHQHLNFYLWCLLMLSYRYKSICLWWQMLPLSCSSSALGSHLHKMVTNPIQKFHHWALICIRW
jgi:hypothetical protein